MFLFSGKREKAPASTSFFNAHLSSDGAQCLPFVCMRGAGELRKKHNFFQTSIRPKYPHRPVSDVSVQKYNAGN